MGERVLLDAGLLKPSNNAYDWLGKVEGKVSLSQEYTIVFRIAVVQAILVDLFIGNLTA